MRYLLAAVLLTLSSMVSLPAAAQQPGRLI